MVNNPEEFRGENEKAEKTLPGYSSLIVARARYLMI